MQNPSIASIIGFFVVVLTVGYVLHRILSKTGIYKKKIKGKGFFSGFLYTIVLIVVLYIVLLVIFGILNLIDF
ncbi:hypothetical protein [uncultured Dokdonia sp.]|uniref:hypothetical protein n=1 Tax=uncultured Dokdonia sp. TaxID=575653 RepID=UPI002607994D|nr:hypothetical protein [uncultured Dokdonia sp.]